jgi:4-amino-4-deoxy-L-arabinose transferase-like glycosyltransferase
VTPDRRTILALFSLAFGLRILYAVLIGTSAEINPNPYSYDFLIARKIATGANWWSQPLSPAAPGYQFLLAALFRIGGVHHWLVIVLQAIMGGITVFFLFRIGEKSLGPAVGLLSAIWLSFYVHHQHFTSLMVRDVTATMLFVFVCYLTILYTYRVRGVVWTALAYATLVHIDPQYLLFFPFIALYFVLYATRHKLLNVQFMFLFLGMVLVLLTPWTIRNARVYGEPIPVGLEAVQYVRPLQSLFGQGAEEAATEDLAAKNATEYRPGWWRNTLEFWRVTRIKGVDQASDAQGPPPWSLRHNFISVLTYGLLLPFFLVGIWLSLKKRHRAGLLLTATIVGYYLIRAHYGGSPRARLPIDPLIMLLAFYALTELYAHYRARTTSEES